MRGNDIDDFRNGRAPALHSSGNGDARAVAIDPPHHEVPMRILLMTAALVTALAGTLLSGRDAPVQSDGEPLDIALFV